LSPILGIYASQISGHLFTFPASSYESIQTVTVGAGGASSVTFSSIPSTYSHLQIRATARTTFSAPVDCNMRYNADTGNNYDAHYLRGDGSSVSAGFSGSNISAIFVGNLSYNTTAPYNSTFNAMIIDILDYNNTNKYKTSRSLSGYDTNGNGTYPGLISLMSGLWMNTNAITSINLYSGDGANLPQYSSFALYGIKEVA